MDEDGLLLDPYHEINHQYHPVHHRPTACPGQILRAESTKSDNSLDDHPLGRNLYREPTNTVPNPNQRELGQYKIVEVDPDAIHEIGDAELQQLPEAVNREIIINSREIVYEEEPREIDTTREDNFSTIRPPMGIKRHPMKYPLLDEEKRSLNGSRRNLNHRNFVPIIDDEKKSLNGSKRNLSNKNLLLSDDDVKSANGSKRNLNGSKRYLLLAVDKGDGWNGSAKNLYVDSRENLVGSRRHTGSKERLNVIKRTVAGVKGSKENPELKTRRKHNEIVSDCQKRAHVEIEIEKSRKNSGYPESMQNEQQSNRTLLLSADSANSESLLTPESGFAESNHSGSSPEMIRKELRLPSDSVITRNRRSYEHAQLQDVNEALTSSSSESSSSDSDTPVLKDVKKISVTQKNGRPNSANRQTISYTSV